MDTCLDFTNPITLEFLAYLEANDILMNITEWNGPGGGNPVVEYTGTEEALRELLSSEIGFDCDDEDVEYYMSEWAS